MNIIVTGAAGLVGSNLMPHICMHNITAIDKNHVRLQTIKKLYPYITVVEADISKKGSWEKLFSKADIVIQLQAQISAPEKKPYIQNNVTSVKNVTDCCKKYEVKHLIHLSSSVVISVSNDYYVQTKLEGEKYVLESGVPCTILRPPLMYGCFDYKHTSSLVAIMEKTFIMPLPGTGKFIRQPLYVQDMCKIIAHCVKSKPSNKTHNIIGKEKIQFREMLKIVAKQRKMRIMFLPIPLWFIGFAVRCYKIINPKSPFVVDQLQALTAGDVFPVDNWEKTFNVKYTSFRKGIADMIADKRDVYRAGHEGS